MGSGGGPGHGSMGEGDSPPATNENDADKAHEGDMCLDYALPQGWNVKVELDEWE